MAFSPVGFQNVGYNPYAAPQQSVIEQKLNLARQETSQIPFKGLINYADMWFNLRNNPQLPIKLSEELKWQLYFLSGATMDANEEIKFIDQNGKVDANYFSIDHLKTDDLIMLFRIVVSCHSNAPNQNMSEDQSDRDGFGSLFRKVIDKIYFLGKQSPQAKAEVLQKFKAQNAPEFDEAFYVDMARGMKTDDERTLESLEQEIAFLISINQPESVIQAHMQVVECFKTKNTVLNLSQIELERIPNSLQVLSHVKTIYLNLSSDYVGSDYFNSYNFSLKSLQNLEEIGFLRAPFTEKKLQMHKELNAWCKEVRGKEEYGSRLAVFFQIIRNYEASQTENPSNDIFIDGTGLSSLPACIKELTHLEVIQVENCEFTSFPECILQLPNLRVIGIVGRYDYNDDTRLTKCEMKEVPKEIANLKRLEIFNVSNTKITTLPPEIASIETLRDIVVNNNKIVFLPNTLARLSYYSEISAKGNPLNPEWLDYFNTLLETAKREGEDLGPRFTHEEEDYGFQHGGPSRLFQFDGEIGRLDSQYYQSGQVVKTQDERILESLEQEIEYSREHNFPESIIQANLNILDCFKTKNTSLNLSQIKLTIEEIPRNIAFLSHVKTVYLNLSHQNQFGDYFPSYYNFSFLNSLKDLEEIGFLSAPFTEKKLQLHRELNAWCKEVRGLDEYAHRIAAFYRIIKNFETTETGEPNTNWSLDRLRLSSLPDCLKELTHLTSIYVFDCEFTTFPKCILHLTNLREIVIRGAVDYVDDAAVVKCEIKEIPKEIANLTHLEEFMVSGTKITTLPPEMATIETLRHIRVSDNQITFIPNALARLPWDASIEVLQNPLNQEWLGYFNTLLETTRRENGNLGPKFTYQDYVYKDHQIDDFGNQPVQWEPELQLLDDGIGIARDFNRLQFHEED